VVDTSSLDLGLVSRLAVESFGEPGRRTFRIYAETAEGALSLWLEKEQVVGLANALDELLDRVAPPRGTNPTSDARSTFMGDLEVKVATLAVGYDPHADGFTITGSEFLTDLPLKRVSLLADRGQVEQARDQSEEIVAAGRPRCLLCGTPLTGEPHFCPQSNGHSHVDRADVED
jgi:uncharacterized repeat protein (TIGR03847 family)